MSNSPTTQATSQGFDKPAYDKFIAGQGIPATETKLTKEMLASEEISLVPFPRPQAKPAPVRVMVDLETWGTAPGSAIASIGAVKFGGDGPNDIHGQFHATFYCRVDVSSCLKAGMKIDFNTIQWWLEQSEEARQEMAKKGGASIADALREFATWMLTKNLGTTVAETNKMAELWGNGAAFDNALLSEAYRLCGIEQPWKFWNDRCYRTMKNMFPQVKMQPRTGTHHNALDDAKNQALHLIAIFSEIESMKFWSNKAGTHASEYHVAKAELATAKGELERMMHAKDLLEKEAATSGELLTAAQMKYPDLIVKSFIEDPAQQQIDFVKEDRPHDGTSNFIESLIQNPLA